MSTATLHVESLHRLAHALHVPVSRIVKIIDELSLRPVLRIDSTPYYSAEQADEIAQYLRAPKDKQLTKRE